MHLSLSRLCRLTYYTLATGCGVVRGGGNGGALWRSVALCGAVGHGNGNSTDRRMAVLPDLRVPATASYLSRHACGWSAPQQEQARHTPTPTAKLPLPIVAGAPHTHTRPHGPIASPSTPTDAVNGISGQCSRCNHRASIGCASAPDRLCRLSASIHSQSRPSPPLRNGVLPPFSTPMSLWTRAPSLSVRYVASSPSRSLPPPQAHPSHPAHLLWRP